MEYKKINEALPSRPNITNTLRNMNKIIDCVLFPLNDIFSVRNTMSRLKKTEGMLFTSENDGEILKVWRIN